MAAGGKWARRHKVLTAALLSGCVSAALLPAAGVIIHLATGQGEVIIESDDAGVEIVVEQNGKAVRFLTPGQASYVLDTGEYTLRLAGNPDSLKIELPEGPFRLRCGDRQPIVIRRVPPSGGRPGIVAPAVTDFREIHGADGATLQAWMDGLPLGRRPVYMSAEASSSPRFNAVAIHDGRRVPWRFVHGLDNRQGGSGPRLARHGRRRLPPRALLDLSGGRADVAIRRLGRRRQALAGLGGHPRRHRRAPARGPVPGASPRGTSAP